MAAKYIGVLLCLFIALCKSQKTPGFNDSTAAGTEREIELLNADIIIGIKTADNIIDTIFNTFDQIHTPIDSSSPNLASQKKISTDITTAMNDVAREANKAGFPFCAAKANAFSFTAIPKYLNQINIVNDLYKLSAFKTKAQGKALNATLSSYKKDNYVAAMRSCTAPFVAIFGNVAVVNCYKREMAALTNFVRNINASLELLKVQFEDTTKRHNEFISVVNTTLLDAKTATDIAVNDVLECAKLTSNVDYSKELLEEVKLDINNTIKLQIKKFNEKIDRAINILNNDALKYQENLKAQIITPLINAYEKTFSIIPNQFLSLNERIANVNKFFDGNKNYATIMYEGLRISRYGDLRSLVKTVDQNFDVTYAIFTLGVTTSKCIKTNKPAFLSCIDPLLKVFLANKTSAENEIMTHESVVDFLISLNSSLPIRPTQRIKELLETKKFEFDYQKYLVERSQSYLKTVVDATPSRVELINKVNNFTDLINSLNLNFQNTLQTTLITGNNTELKVYIAVAENKIQSEVDELKVLIESLKPKLQKTELEIQSQIKSYKDFIVYCDGPEYKICVDAQYDAKDSKLSAAVNLFNALDVATIESKIEILKVEIEKTLKEAEEKAKLEKEKAMENDTRRQIITNTIQKYIADINRQTPAVDRIISIEQAVSGVLKDYYERAARNPNLNVLFVLGNAEFSKNFKDFGGCNAIDIVNAFSKGMGNHAQVLRQIENQSRSVSDSYLYDQCSNVTTIKECLESQLVVPNLNVTLSNEIYNTFYIEALN